jgi:hypothetical protein
MSTANQMKDDRLNLYKSLFKGREHVFTLRLVRNI